MKAPREYKRWLDWARRKHGKGNGVVPAGCLDSPRMERKLANNKRRRKPRFPLRMKDEG